MVWYTSWEITPTSMCSPHYMNYKNMVYLALVCPPRLIPGKCCYTQELETLWTILLWIMLWTETYTITQNMVIHVIYQCHISYSGCFYWNIIWTDQYLLWLPQTLIIVTRCQPAKMPKCSMMTLSHLSIRMKCSNYMSPWFCELIFIQLIASRDPLI